MYLRLCVCVCVCVRGWFQFNGAFCSSSTDFGHFRGVFCSCAADFGHLGAKNGRFSHLCAKGSISLQMRVLG